MCSTHHIYTLLKPSYLQNYHNIHPQIVHCNFSDEIYIAPSGVQKERILPEDLFIQNIEGDDIQLPPEYKK